MGSEDMVRLVSETRSLGTALLGKLLVTIGQLFTFCLVS